MLLQEHGSIVRTLFTAPKEKWVWGWFLSPNRRQMVVVLSEDWRARHEPYLVDMLTGDSRHLETVGRDWNFSKLKHIRWSRALNALVIFPEWSRMVDSL